MSSDDKMTVDERQKYLRAMKKRYRQASKKGRGRLLDEMEAIIGLHRKSLIRLMRGPLTRKRRRQQRVLQPSPRPGQPPCSTPPELGS